MGAIQWDGKYLDVSFGSVNNTNLWTMGIYQTAISGSTLTTVHAITFQRGPKEGGGRGCNSGVFFSQWAMISKKADDLPSGEGKQLLAANGFCESLDVWKYPAGNRPHRSLKEPVKYKDSEPNSVTYVTPPKWTYQERRADALSRADEINAPLRQYSRSMRTIALNRFALTVSITMLLAGCGGSQPPIGAPGTMLQAPVASQAVRPAEGSGPFLYVGGNKVAMFALGSSKPLHVTKSNPYSAGNGLALDLQGHLCVSTGNPSYQAIYEYDAQTLKLLGETDRGGYFSALVADRYGYLYASSVFGVLVYAPGCTQRVNNLRHGGRALVFDRSGNLYAGLGNAVGVYEPEQRRGHMRFVRKIHDGLRPAVSALAIGPSDELFVADEIGRKGGYVLVYRRGGSQPVEKITKGVETPALLAVDSKGWLYVDNRPYTTNRSGWISVYAPGSTEPVRRVHVYNAVALAIDPSDNLYVLNSYRRSTVLVYSPGAAKLLRKITDSVNYSAGLLIGSP